MKELLLIAFFFCLPFTGHAQSILDKKINFRASQTTLKAAIFKLSEQTNIGFTFSGAIIPKKVVAVNFQQEKLGAILAHLFDQTGVGYKFVDNQIILFKKGKIETKYLTISGYIKDAETGERLIAANVFESELEKGIATNEYGFYSITLPAGNRNLNFSFLGYKPSIKKIRLKKNTQLDIFLKPSLTLSEVIISSKGTLKSVNTPYNATKIPVAEMNQLPILGGEEDLLRMVHSLPGVQTGADGFGGLHVRGGSADQNLILLDGVPVYNATHLGGLFSIFNNSAIKNAQLYKGNFPARYGGRLSSVLDVRTKEGNQKKWAGMTGLSLTAVKAVLEGPIVQNKSSFFVSFRRSIFDTYLKPISRRIKQKKGDKGVTRHSFADFNSKINFRLTKKDEVFLSFYHGRDNFKDENNSTTSSALDFKNINHRQDLDWGNAVGAFRWNHLFNDRLFANVTLTFSKFWFKSEEFYQESIATFAQEEEQIKENLFYNLYNSSIEDKAAKIDFDFIPSTNHYIKFGISAINHTFRPGAFTLDHKSVLGVNDLYNPDSLIAVNNTTHSQEYSAYLEDNFSISSQLKGNLGLRTNLLNVQGVQYVSFQPRLSIQYEFPKSLFIKTSIGKMTQNLHLLTSSGVGLPTDLWVPATSKVKPQEAWQLSFGIEKWLGSGIEVSTEFYYRKMKNLITYQEGSSFLVESIVLDANDWENKVTIGNGKSYGAELSLKKVRGDLKGWLSYTYSKSKRQFEAINFGKTYDFRYDRPHSFKIAGTYQLNNKISLSAAWLYESGIATTIPSDEYTFYSSNLFSPVTVLNVGEKNSFRLPDNHHLDIGINFYLSKKKGQQILKFGVYNLYNHKNPLYYRLKEKPDGSGEKEFVQVTLLPITPSLSYSIQL